MKLKEYLKTSSLSLEELAAATGAKPSYLKRLASGAQKPGPGLAIKIEEATQGKVRRADLRPDLWV